MQRRRPVVLHSIVRFSTVTRLARRLGDMLRSERDVVESDYDRIASSYLDARVTEVMSPSSKSCWPTYRMAAACSMRDVAPVCPSSADSGKLDTTLSAWTSRPVNCPLLGLLLPAI